VAAIFSSRLLNRKSPVVYEDGGQSRDFIHVTDIARANVMVMQSDKADYQVFNVGSGQPVAIRDVAQKLSDYLSGGEIRAEITGQFREGDIRHCYADITKIRTLLGFEPSVYFDDGISELVEWVRTQTAADRFEEARKELEARGLTRK
jgi:dTDP-L-rhamnose 4-epimerase